jgi:hypothetical protein
VTTIEFSGDLATLIIASKLLNGLHNYKVVLVPLATKKEIGCSAQYCTEILTVASPDDHYIYVALEKPKEGEYMEREYKCSKNHITKVYWYPPSFHVAVG